MAALMLLVMGAFAEFERSLAQGTPAGGHRTGQTAWSLPGPQAGLTPKFAAELAARAAAGEPKSVLACEYELSRETVYQYLRRGQASD